MTSKGKKVKAWVEVFRDRPMLIWLEKPTKDDIKAYTSMGHPLVYATISYTLPSKPNKKKK